MAQPKRSYLSYDEACEYVQKRAIHSRDHYWRWWSSHKPHPPVPKMPNRVYPEWDSWNAYLGTTNVFDPERAAKRKKHYRPFWEAVRAAQQYAKQHHIDTKGKWCEWYDSGMCPVDIPKRPDQTYKEFVGTGWKVWLGLGIESRVETAKQEVAVMAICQLAGQPANMVTMVIEGQGLTALKEKWDPEIVARPYRVYKWEKGLIGQVDHLMERFAHKREERVWLVPNLNALLFELDTLLEYAVSPRSL